MSHFFINRPIFAWALAIMVMLAGVLAYMFFMSAQRLIFDTDNPLANAKKYVPFYMVFAAFMMAFVTVSKGLKHVGLHLTSTEGFMLCVAIALVVGIIGKIAISRLKIDPEADKEMHFNNVEKIFGILTYLPVFIFQCAL